MARWWTSDLHLGHHNIITYSGRPFTTAAEMDEALIAAWNEVVAPVDDVWVLGDFAMGGLAEHLPLAGLLNGHKTLVAGNHDACWQGRKKDVERWTESYLDAGFEHIIQGPSTATVGSTAVVVDHFPYRGDSRDVERYVEHRPVDRGAWLLHGHVHERWRQQGRQVNVGVDAWGGRPVGDDELICVVSGGPRDLAPVCWPKR